MENRLILSHLFYIGENIKESQCFEKYPEKKGYYINKNGTVMNFDLLKSKNNNPPPQKKYEAVTDKYVFVVFFSFIICFSLIFLNSNFSFVESCGRTFSKNFVTNRVHNDIDWPWLAAIYLKNIRGLDFLCTGTLVSNKHILTGIKIKHCTYKNIAKFLPISYKKKKTNWLH